MILRAKEGMEGSASVNNQESDADRIREYILYHSALVLPYPLIF